MSRSIAVFGVGPGLGQAVARRYSREGYAVVLVARRQEPLDRLAEELTSDGARAHAIGADLSDSDAIPALSERIRATVGDLDAIYYGAAANGFIPVLDLTSRRVQDIMPLGVYTLLALVREFLTGWSYVAKTRLVRGLVLGILGAFAGAGVVVGTAQFYARSLGGGDLAARRARVAEVHHVERELARRDRRPRARRAGRDPAFGDRVAVGQPART